MPWRPWQHGDRTPFLSEAPLGVEEEVYVSEDGRWMVRKVTEFRLFKDGVGWGVFASVEAAQARVTLEDAAGWPACDGSGEKPWQMLDGSTFGQCFVCGGWYELRDGRVRRHPTFK